MEGTCFLKPKASDVAKLRSLPPPEEDIDPEGVVSSTIVDDSDEEFELPPPLPVVSPPVVVETPIVIETPIVVETPVVTEEPKKKRIISKKKE